MTPVAPRAELAATRSALRAARAGATVEPAAEQPVARVAVDVPLAHLDRPFDYLVPSGMSEHTRPGVRIRVRFAGQLVDGYVLDRVDRSEHAGTLAYIHKVVSPEPVLSAEIAELARAVADRYAGTMSDVLRLAVPPRHARAEAAPPTSATSPVPPEAADVGSWARYEGGADLVAALRAGAAPRIVWTALPGPDWAEAIAAAACATLAGGRGSVIVLPDGHDVARVDAALSTRLGSGHHVTLSADVGPAERYRRFLALRRGGARVAVGTRAAMFAPVADLGLAVVWDDGNDLHAEPHAPYPHVRKVLALRSSSENAALLVGGFSRTAEGAQMLAEEWAQPVAATRVAVRDAAPRVQAAGEDAELARDAAARSARLPTLAWQAATDALRAGPVLVQVPRHGYAPALSCDTCRTPARCTACAGPLAAPGPHRDPRCRWCGTSAAAWQCATCDAQRLRAVIVGAARTAEELGRAFPRVRVRTSDRDGVLAGVGREPALVVTTPGAEPMAEAGYAAALLLDGWALLARADLRAGEEALRRWMNAGALVRPSTANGVVIVLADPAHAAVQALVRWDPGGYADRELAERSAARLPPAVRMASITGEPVAVRRLLALAELPDPVDVLGPVPVLAGGAHHPDGSGEAERFLVRVPRHLGPQLVSALRAAIGVRSAHKEPGAVRVQVDPLEFA